MAAAVLALAVVGPAVGQPPPEQTVDPVVPDQALGSPSCLPPLWRAPVAAAVVDPYRPPSDPYGPGNRGIEYGTADGEPVLAVADGRVGFVGPVGGVHYLVIHHTHDLRSTYGPLRTVAVEPGDEVVGGLNVATAASGLHLTARVGDVYVDPNRYLARWCRSVRLVPVPPAGSLRPLDG